jgi:hypothetical protein
LWRQPRIRLKEFHPRNYLIWGSIGDFLGSLKERG